MTTNRTDWKYVLPVNRFEMWLLRIWLLIGTAAIGALLMILWLNFMTKSNFQGGAEWMQDAYTKEGKVLRVKVTDVKDLKELNK